jgi:hypothetical protein
VPKAIAAVESQLPSGFPEEVWDAITAGMQRQAGRFLAQLGPN